MGAFTRMTDAAAAAVAAIDTDRLVELVTQVCRIPSVLGDEGPLAEFLHGVMKDSGFAATARTRSASCPSAPAGGSCSPGTWTPSPSRTAGP
jgi:hypothetical protein